MGSEKVEERGGAMSGVWRGVHLASQIHSRTLTTHGTAQPNSRFEDIIRFGVCSVLCAALPSTLSRPVRTGNPAEPVSTTRLDSSELFQNTQVLSILARRGTTYVDASTSEVTTASQGHGSCTLSTFSGFYSCFMN